MPDQSTDTRSDPSGAGVRLPLATPPDVGFWCPRRAEARAILGGPMFYPDPADDAGTGETPPDRWRGPEAGERSGTCTYCGSVSPQEFLAYVRAGLEVGPTDKSYKAYLQELPSLAPERWTVYSSCFPGHPEHGHPDGEGWMTAEEAEAVQAGVTDGHLGARWYQLRPQGPTRFAKFYFQHIAHPSPERAEWYDLVMGGGVRWGYPGHWYAHGMTGIRAEHIRRHPEEATDKEREAIAAALARMPGRDMP